MLLNIALGLGLCALLVLTMGLHYEDRKVVAFLMFLAAFIFAFLGFVM